MHRRCQVVVGTPGRVCKLLEMGALVVRNCRTLVLDEADHLLSDSFVRDIRLAVQMSQCHGHTPASFCAQPSNAPRAGMGPVLVWPSSRTQSCSGLNKSSS